MSNWKKIIVSGSQAHLSSVTASNGSIISGSLTMSGSITNVDNVDFNMASPVANAAGRLVWDDGNGSLDLGLKGGNVNLVLGQQTYARVYNAEATTLNKGEVVYISGSQGNRVSAKRADYIGEQGSATTIGFVAESIASGAEGFIITNGVLEKLNTVGLTQGALLYLSSSGQYSQTKPIAPQHTVTLGYVERVHATVGSIYVKIDNGYELNELHNVLTNGATYGDLLFYSASLWTHTKQLSGSYGVTGSLDISGNLIINGTSYTAATSGTSGTSGANGSSGTSGNSGSSGTSGDNGTSGSSGSSGASGSSGTSGANGAAGSSGTSGNSGSSGTSGNSGSSGTSGNSGSSGTSGANGSSGTSGTGFTTISGASNDRILTSDGSSNSAVAETNLNFDGSTLTVTGSAIISATTRLTDVEERELTVTIGGTPSSLSLDLSQANVFEVTYNNNVNTFTISNPPATDYAGSFTLVTTGNGSAYAWNWGSAVTWSGGSAPAITTTAGKRDIYGFITTNQGTNWYGFIGAQNL